MVQHTSLVVLGLQIAGFQMLVPYGFANLKRRVQNTRFFQELQVLEVEVVDLVVVNHTKTAAVVVVVVVVDKLEIGLLLDAELLELEE